MTNLHDLGVLWAIVLVIGLVVGLLDAVLRLRRQRRDARAQIGISWKCWCCSKPMEQPSKLPCWRCRLSRSLKPWRRA